VQRPLPPGERSHQSMTLCSLHLDTFKPVPGICDGVAPRSAAVHRRRRPLSMFGGATGGDAAGMDAAVITIFVVAVVLVAMIALREFGRRR